MSGRSPWVPFLKGGGGGGISRLLQLNLSGKKKKLLSNMIELRAVIGRDTHGDDFQLTLFTRSWQWVSLLLSVHFL